MNDPKIPSYPIVHATIQPDGSTHLNAAGDHQNYPPGELTQTRERVKAYAIEVATRLGRGVRLTTTDPDGQWRLGVYPDGEVIDLAPAALKGRAAIKPNPLRGSNVPRAATATPKASPAATLTFSTGDTVIIGPPALVGRRPEAGADDPRDVQLVTINDIERNVSRTHASIRWVDGRLVVTDRGAGNGTAVARQSDPQQDLEAGKPYELQTGDLVRLGTVVTCRVFIPDRDHELGKGLSEH